MEYQRLMKMKEERLTKKATMQAMEMGSRNFVDDTPYTDYHGNTQYDVQ